jgi:hypothetical protein
MSDLGRLLVVAGILLLIVGGLFLLLPRMGVQLGRLPGDFRFSVGQMTCMIPIATSILLSVLLTIGLNLLLRFLSR